MLHQAAVFLPLIGALLAGLGGLGARASQMVTCLLMLVAAAISVWLFIDVALDGHARVIELAPWMVSGDFSVSWSLRYDTLTAVMVAVVNVVSSMIHIYSVGYMEKDPHKPRFFAYLSLFTFFMLMLVTSDNLIQLFFGWEGVGLASYLLIGFWYDRPAANAAALKAFIVNRVGDFGFLLGILAIYLLFGSVNFETIFAQAPFMAEQQFLFLGFELHALSVIGLLLFIGAMGKSAQIGLHTWLPDAMEGPTPVSALIHAATMVTAGVFMVARMSPLLEYAPQVLAVIAVVGAVTAFFAATIAVTQTDIKRVIAYSTCSQLGYMFFACGVSAYGAAIFHLMTHAFFKALLFLGAGSVIHAMSDEQDMRRMGGLARHIRMTYLLMWVGSLALMGVPFFAGYYSKDIILEAAWAADSMVGSFAFMLGLAAAVLTAFYSGRLLFMTFHGTPRADEQTLAHLHESPPVMIMPLLVLAFGAVFAGYFGYGIFVGAERFDFWAGSLVALGDPIAAAHQVPVWVKLSPIVMAAFGLAVAVVAYLMIPGLPQTCARMMPWLYDFLRNKWYFDELYDRLFVRPALVLGRGLWKSGDGDVIDAVGPDGVAASIMAWGRRITALQTGYLYHYAFAMIIGVTALAGWYLYLMIGAASTPVTEQIIGG